MQKIQFLQVLIMGKKEVTKAWFQKAKVGRIVNKRNNQYTDSWRKKVISVLHKDLRTDTLEVHVSYLLHAIFDHEPISESIRVIQETS